MLAIRDLDKLYEMMAAPLMRSGEYVVIWSFAPPRDREIER
jgi:hypothetical protein